MCVYSKSVSVCACVSPICVHAAKTWMWMWDLFIFSSSSRSVESVTKKSQMNWRPLHWELKLHKKKSLQHESRENAAGNKCNWFLCVCARVCARVLWTYVCVCACVCVTVIWRANRERASNTRSHSGSPQKSHLLTMYCCNTRICTNVKSWKQLSIWLLVNLDLVFRPVELYSLA